ncbi:MAG: hypothetical protein GQ540_05845 [Lutibacter sp.]|uniref:DUF4175 family protein n=1 Tax=Lutibacter sp. TaxID=1925666 RepID=UPI0019F3E465|nr:DUF4175 family protein [Lutibacter sp.]NOR28032.1 hypothetical protein [Lutibacter sp.]
MSTYKSIEVKLQNFIKKFYYNELIKGLLLFFGIGLLYFIATLFIEHFLWLKPFARTALFWVFILVELSLFTFYILIPIVKLVGFKKGISEVEASKIIGNHFPEINDKLLNMLQLYNTEQNSELISASIEQKSKELQPIPFRGAVDFSKNKKFIKYALIPIVIWLLVYVTGNITIFNDSFSRVVHYNTQFEPPAPFSFIILNTSFNVVEGDSYTLQIETKGTIIPEDAKINFFNENYYLENLGFGKFQYVFSSVKKSIHFSLEANGVISKTYQINSIATPVITNLKMVLNYPNYTGKRNEVIQNTGNAIVPQGTNISWQIETHQTNSISFLEQQNAVNFKQVSNDYFSYSKDVFSSINYKIATSNTQLTNHESLNFGIQVILDEHPKIIVKSDIDSISRGPAQFIGQISDDYGIKKLQLVYYNKNEKNVLKTYLITVSKSSFSDFYYVFPEGISIEEGIDYELYFEVFDNDAVNGSKKTKSNVFSYYNKTEKELKEALLKEQKETIHNISKTLEKSKLSNAEVEKFKNTLQKKADINWNDTKKLEEFIKRQTKYQELFKKQTNQLEENLNEQSKDPDLKDKQEELQKRIEETKKLAEQEKLVDELKELTEKLDKEDLVDKLKELAKKNKQNEQSLERILELTKRFYVEQKANQISEKLDELAKKEKELSKQNEEENTSEKQEEIKKDFEAIKKDFEELEKQNKDLKRPMKLPDSEDEKSDIDKDLNKALDDLKKQDKNSAKKSQKSASKKMKELSEAMEQSMEASEGEFIDENIEDLRKIVENLIEFSFQQEDLLDRFSSSDNHHPEYPKNIKQQHVLKEYFEHIDDSLYVLSLRLVKMSSAIQKEVSDAHYHIDESLLNFTENRFDQGISNQQFVITAANNLANSLSNLLESLMNASPSFGKGKGSPQEFSLPDIIKKQGELMDKMKEGMKKGKKPGDKPGEKKGNKPGEGEEQMNGELYEIYKQQSQLKELLKEILGKEGVKKGNGSGDAVKQMEELEKQLLEKGFTQEVIQKMQQLNYELLKLEKATLQQGEDKKRTSETNIEQFQKRTIDKLKLQNLYFNYNEILNRQSLPLRTIYKKKVQEYFKTEQQ